MSEAHDVSADGSVVVGWSTTSADVGHAFRWTITENIQDLGTFGGRRSGAFGVSADGSIVVGSADSQTTEHAFRWTTEMEQIISDPSVATDVSANGLVIVGRIGHVFNIRAFRWTVQGLQSIELPNRFWIEASGVSADGSVVVGYSFGSDGLPRAFRWTQASGVNEIDHQNSFSIARDVSADGGIVVGRSSPSGFGDCCAFRWTTQTNQIENLNETYASLLTNGSQLHEAYGISPDGRYIVGWGYNAATQQTEAYLLDTQCTNHNGDVDNSGCVDDADLLAVLFAFGSSGQNLGRVDVNCDGTVDDADLLQVLFNFGSGC